MAAYRQWLRDSLRTYVKVHETETLRVKFESDVAAAAGNVDTDLGGI